MDFGLNLYSLRSLIKTSDGFLDTATKLKDMGYSFLQFSGGVYDADVIKSVSEKTAMPIVLTHVPMTRILNETDVLMKEHESFGCHNIGLGAMPRETLNTDEAVARDVEALNKAGEHMAKNGFKFFYHHHQIEFKKMSDGTTIMDYIIKNAPFINFTVDTYWLQYGGVSILEYINKLNGRIECAHLKDYKINADFSPKIAPVSEGNINFADVIPALLKVGAKYLLVEQDNAVEAENPLDQVEISIKYLKNNF